MIVHLGPLLPTDHLNHVLFSVGCIPSYLTALRTEKGNIVAYNQILPSKIEYVAGAPLMYIAFLRWGCRQRSRGASILTASWNADTCSLAMATTAGGVRIYDLLPTPQGPNASVVTRSDSLCARGTARRTVPARLILRHEILMKNVSTTPEGTARVACRQVDLLCSDDSSASGHAGAGILVGIADGHHLCLWDLTTGCTLFTASAVAPEGCKIEKMAWHGAAALLALLCSEGGSSTTLAVHQIDVVAHKMIAVGESDEWSAVVGLRSTS